MVESTLPVTLIQHEIAASGSPLNGQLDELDDTPDVEEILSTFRAMLQGLPKDPATRNAVAEQLANAEPFSRFPGLIQEVIESESPKED